MSTIMAIVTLIWLMINFFLISLFCYIRWLLSKRHMTIFERNAERIRRKFEKKRG